MTDDREQEIRERQAHDKQHGPTNPYSIHRDREWLLATLVEARQQLAEQKTNTEFWQQGMDEARATIARLEQELRAYGRAFGHLPSCEIVVGRTDEGPDRCNCGLDAALDGTRRD